MVGNSRWSLKIGKSKKGNELTDHESFTIPCTISTHFSGKILCNLGANINLMPYSIYRTLGLEKAKPTRVILQLADISLTYPKGVIEDILVKVDKFIFFANFIILDMKVDNEIAIILRRPFLATVDEDNEEDLKIVKRLDLLKKLKLKGVEPLEMPASSQVLKYSIEESPMLELKPLPSRKAIKSRNIKSAIGWTIANIKGISPSFWMYKMLLKDDHKASVETHGLSLNMHNELIPIRTVTGCRVCMDYRKLNKATRKDYFSLHFIDQILDRLADNAIRALQCTNNILKMYDNDLHRHVKLETIEKLPPPTSIKAIRSFLGHARFYQRFIKEFSKISKSLCNLLEKDIPFKFDDTYLHASNELKKKRQLKDKIFRFIYYASKALNNTQLNYTTTEKELLIVVFAFDKFRFYLMSTKVIVYADHFAIRYLIEKKNAKPMLIRWVLLLQEFDLEIRDRKGSKNQTADHLSRLESHTKPVKPNLINGNFLDKQLFAIVTKDVLWYHDIVNYLTCEIIPLDPSALQKKRFLFNIIFWDELVLFRQCFDNIMRYCVRDIEMNNVLAQCHIYPYGGHFQGDRTTTKILEKTISSTHKNWSKRLDKALWAYRTAFKTSKGCLHTAESLEKLVICPLGEKRLLQFNELNEFRFQADKNAKIYKEKKKKWHEKKIVERHFESGQYVFLFDSCLKLFPGKLKSCWFGPICIAKVFSHGVAELENESSRNRFNIIPTKSNIIGDESLIVNRPQSP
ncbi:DNA-directed DNA polymerase [Handroanthus impetiginosus]|uniref:RNA-directed DNA polymerase n=1 Tax=Handroanthus impetiginosus TaxID=429701 RepID=A0A2G9HAV8_9LAMI|nr:DNA-directed DNA polymerase [Handroanthus impetiginosus]